jgi:hypothetical protein
MSSLLVCWGLFLRLRSLRVILLLLTLAVAGCGGGSGNGGSGAGSGGSSSNNTPLDYGTRPVVKNLHIAVDTYDENTGYAGDMYFSSQYEFDTVHTQKAFMEFNGLLIDDGTGLAGGRLPHFTFVVPAGTAIYSMSDGIVMAVEQNPNVSDFEVRIAPDDTSRYLLVYDHLDQVTVSAGDTVVAGEQIAQATTMKVEADVTLDHSVSLCPVDFFDPSVATQLEDKLTQLMLDWETFKKDDTLYDEASMYKPGCVTQASDDPLP